MRPDPPRCVPNGLESLVKREKEKTMFARVASFEGVNVDAAQRTMDDAEEIIRPLMEGLDGYQGFLQLVAPNGKVLSITLFDSEASAQAAEQTFDEEMPSRLG